MAARDTLSPDEVRNNYQYKVTRRIVMDKFPWITDITLQDNELNDYNLIFVNIFVDIKKFMETYDVKPMSYLRGYKGRIYNSSSLSTTFDMTYEDGRDIADDVEKVMEDVGKTTALPQELKLPTSRRLTPGIYHTPIPENISELI